MVEKLRECFDEMVVYKDLKKSNFFSALSLPSFLRDWLLKNLKMKMEISISERYRTSFTHTFRARTNG